jgi:hypothetical protein
MTALAQTSPASIPHSAPASKAASRPKRLAIAPTGSVPIHSPTT